jgi:uncharacterized protein YkwD
VVSIARTTAFVLFAACLGLPGAALAGAECGDLVTDGAALKTAGVGLATACPCAPGGARERAAFTDCVADFVGNAVKSGLIRSECRFKLRSNATKSTCGRPSSSVVCCSQRDGGENACRIAKTAGACESTSAVRAWLGDGESCADACASACSSAFDCSDGDPCTADVCDPELGCSHNRIAGCTAEGGPTNCTGTAESTWAMDRDELALLDIINAERSRRGIRLLQTCRSLAKAAQKHTADMRDADFVSHFSPGGANYIDRMCRAGYGLCRAGVATGEIITAGSNQPMMAYSAWMNSPAHRDIMLHPAFRVIGIGHACGGRYTGYWTANLAGSDHDSCD